MLRELRLTAGDPDDGVLYEPPTREVSLSVIGDTAYLGVSRRDQDTDELTEECSFAVPARSLLLALRAAWDDARPEGAWTDGPTGLSPLELQPDSEPPQEPRPANSHQPWTRDLNERLRREWLDADPDADASELVASIAESMERTRGAIHSRLLKLKCNPEVPGHETGPPPVETSQPVIRP